MVVEFGAGLGQDTRYAYRLTLVLAASVSQALLKCVWSSDVFTARVPDLMFASRRNIADAGWRVVGVEVSADAASAGRHIANKTMAPAALERFELLAYDALALPQVTS